MELSSPQKEIYSHDRCENNEQLEELANRIVFAPLIFQVSRIMIKRGILKALNDNKNGLSIEEIGTMAELPQEALRMLLSVSLIAGTVLFRNGRFFLAKPGWYLIHDKMAEIHMDLNHDVNYVGFFDLEKAILEGKPAGLKSLGNWPTLYEGLSQFPDNVRETWLNFDHFFSDNAFGEALPVVFGKKPKKLLDVGGNTGIFASLCVDYDQDIKVAIMDLPQQLALMRKNIAGHKGEKRISGYPCNLLDPKTNFPKGFDVIWMSQFLDCFSEEEVVSILSRVSSSMTPETTLFIMETFWDRQRFETASFCLAQISLYFTVMANGNSKMYLFEDMLRCIKHAGLKVEKIYDNIGLGHSILEVKSNF